jgi:hypothetical protein
MYVEELEREKAYHQVLRDMEEEGKEGREVAVAVMSVRLQSGSRWIGRFLPEGKSEMGNLNVDDGIILF